MTVLRFSKPVILSVQPGLQRSIVGPDDAADSLIRDWPRSTLDDPLCIAAAGALAAALDGLLPVEAARMAFEAAARENHLIAD